MGWHLYNQGTGGISEGTFKISGQPNWSSGLVRGKEFGEGENAFKLKVINVDGEDYRVPISVIKALKTIAEEKPNLKFVKVKRTGEGMKTEYTVIPLD